jgi:hypothetical protein
MLAETENAQMQILKETALWCDHIIDNCSDVNICSDALILKANISLCLGNAKEVVGILEPTEDPIRLSGQKGLVLVKAYQMVGEYEKAKSHIQIREYMDLLRRYDVPGSAHRGSRKMQDNHMPDKNYNGTISVRTTPP